MWCSVRQALVISYRTPYSQTAFPRTSLCLDLEHISHAAASEPQHVLRYVGTLPSLFIASLVTVQTSKVR